MNSVFKVTDSLKNNSNGGFILLGSTIALFIILSVFSIYLIRVVVKENQISSFNLVDIRSRNLAQSGLDHGIQLFKTAASPYLAPVSKNLNNGQYTITFDPSNNETGNPLPYSHYAMINSSASINDANRNTRLFVSSYPDAFNLAFFGNRTGPPILALSFDGSNDYISTPIGNYFGQNNALSVEAWINVTGTSNGPIFTVTNSPPGGGWNMPFLSINGTTVYGWIWGVNGNTALSHSIALGWHKLSLTYDPNANPTLNFYIDGTNVASGTGQYSPSNAFNYWTTYNPGAKPSGVNSYFNGTIDEVSLWSKALTANEIISNYNGKLSGNETGLAGYWDFNESSGNAIFDQSNNGNDGTITGATRTSLPDPYVESYSQSGGTINGDIYYNGTISGASLTGTAYSSTGSGGTQHPDPIPEFPIANTAYFSAMLDTISPATGSGGEEEEEISGQLVSISGGNVFVELTPSSAVNYLCCGMNNWWKIKIEFQAIGSSSTFIKTWGQNTNGYRSTNINVGNDLPNNYSESQIIVKNIWIHGDFASTSEYLDNVTIGGHNFGRFMGIGDDGTYDLEYSHDGGSSSESSCDGCLALTYGENTRNSTRSWNFDLSSSFSSANNIIIKNIWIRGDFSYYLEYLSNVTIGGHNFGQFNGVGDDGVWDLEFSGNKSVSMSGTSVSASVFVANEVNYAPGGSPYWWQVKVEFYQELEPEEEGGGPLELTNNFNLNNAYPNGLFYGNDISLTGLTVTGTGRIYATGKIDITNCTIAGGIEIASDGEINISNSTLGSNVNSISNSIVLYSKAGLTISGSIVRGLIFNLGTDLAISGSSNIVGALYTCSTSTNISGSTVTGSIVSKYGASLSNSTISKGSLPPSYGLAYGFGSMIMPGSYLEY